MTPTMEEALAAGYASPAAMMEALGTAPWQVGRSLSQEEAFGIQNPTTGYIQGVGYPVEESNLSGPITTETKIGDTIPVAFDPNTGLATGPHYDDAGNLINEEAWLASVGGLVGGAIGGAVAGPVGAAVGGILGEATGGALMNGTSGLITADVPLVGPGVAEPPASIVKKRWETRVYDNTLGYVKLNFYSLTDGRIAMYHNYKKYWKVWRPKKMVVLSPNPRLSMLKKLDRVHKKMQKSVKKFAPKTRVTSTQAPSRFLSAAERKMLNAGQ